MIQVKLKNLSISNFGFVLFLESQEEDNRVLPVFIGAPEAQSIAIHINKVDIPRPLTHDLLKNIMEIVELRLKRVVIHDLKDGTFYAHLIIASDDGKLEIDSRPSDAIALALRANVPIFVSKKVFDEAGITLDEEGHISKVHPDSSSDDPIARLKADLDIAISEERYEDAARLRDEIKKASSSN